ncbi:alpha/beta hydrolase [Halobacterium zhouii]|uniref:alpha/beta hydrolase n=1 Tax=Halobacterium zhouii TaxID=2902624 RepID=UPI001E58C4A5|nr:alpha/beta hydrolase [Halobacterium zhouii]
MSLELVDFEVGGETYEGRLNTQRADADTGVVVVPGAGHGPFGDIFDVISYELAGTGKQVFRFDTWENHEELDEKTLAEIHREVDAAVEYLQSEGCTTIYLLAKSFGGGVTLTYVPDAVERVVLWEPATMELGDESNIDDVEDEQFGDVEEYVVDDDDLGRIDVPVRILCGDAERGMPVDLAEDFASRIPDATVTVIPGEDHGFNTNRTAVVGHTLGFFSDAV